MTDATSAGAQSILADTLKGWVDKAAQLASVSATKRADAARLIGEADQIDKQLMAIQSAVASVAAVT